MDRASAAGVSMSRICLLLFIVLLSGCVGRVTSEDVVGRWEIGERNETIELKSDSTFMHSSSNSERIAVGEWELIGVSSAACALEVSQ